MGAAPRVDVKKPAMSMLTAPRTPVTRWNRRLLMAGAAGIAALVGLGFFVGFGGAHVTPKAVKDPSPAADTNTPQTPEIAGKYPAGYADSAVRAGVPGTAGMPAPGALGQTAATAAPVPVDPVRAEAAAQATAARAGGPFFGGAQGAVNAPGAGVLGFVPQVVGGVRQVLEAGGPNGQGEKRAFAAGSRAEDYLVNPVRGPVSPWEVKAGTVIAAALITALNSDLPGEVIAQVTEPVYDHVTGRTVLIPQGSRLIGQYDSQVAYGQERALIAWNRVIMPNGTSINIGSMTGADLAGASGLHDRVNDHFVELAKGILLSTLFSIGAASAQDAGARSSGGLVLNSAGSGVANDAQEVGQRITERDLGRQPTITVRAGWPLRVLVNKDMVMVPYGQAVAP